MIIEKKYGVKQRLKSIINIIDIIKPTGPELFSMNETFEI